MNVNLTLTKDYRKYDVFTDQKTNPNKPNFRILPQVSGKHFFSVIANDGLAMTEIMRRNI